MKSLVSILPVEKYSSKLSQLWWGTKNSFSWPSTFNGISKLKNLLSIGKNQVLNTSKPQEKIVANLNKKIKELSVGNNSNKLKSKLLKDFRKQLGKENYVSKVGPTVKEFLLENNVKLLRTNPEEYLMKNVPSQLSKSNLKDTYILLEDAVPVK